VSEEQFIQAYTAGRISRRVFVRGLIAGGLSLASALAYGAALEPQAAATEEEPRRHRQHHHHHRHHGDND
jgi:hypothetical protein